MKNLKDKELLFLMEQSSNLKKKVAAIKEFNLRTEVKRISKPALKRLKEKYGF